MMRTALLGLLTTLLACSTSPEALPRTLPEPVDASIDSGVDAGLAVPEAGPDAGFDPVPDASVDPVRDVGVEPAARWDPVTAELERAVAAREIPGYQFVVRTEADAPVYARAGGAFTPQTIIPFDSSIKPITSAVILTLIRDGQLALTDTLGSHLGWTGPEAAVTIEQLLAFSSGFPGNNPCLTPPPQLRNGQLVEPVERASLEQCGATIRASGLVATPGVEFHYGANHQLILALIAERVTRQPWSALFEQRVATPAGLPTGAVRYVNNRVAASAVGTADAFTRLYRVLALDAGFLSSAGSPVLVPRALMDRFTADFIRERGIRLAGSPWAATGLEVHFGLGVWIECTDYARRDTCVYFGSGGNGTTAWMDPSSGHVGALVLYQGSFTGYRMGHTLMTRLLPLVRVAVRR